MSNKRVLKWTVPVDDQPHFIGTGQVVHVACQAGPYEVQVWTEEPWGSEPTESPYGRRARAYGTGHAVPGGWIHIGSVIDLGLVWHLYLEPETVYLQDRLAREGVSST